MYSVIIQNQKTMDQFNDFQPLFSEAINNNRIGICRWFEGGTTIDDALPDIRSLTDDKEEWRAIIIRVVDEDGMRPHLSAPNNPFDFLSNIESDKDVMCESDIPLIRLTHMLAGFPEYDFDFVNESEANIDLCSDSEESTKKLKRTAYTVKTDLAREKAHQKLVEKYSFDGKRPTNIVLITLRKGVNEKENLIKAWDNFKESEASEFWRRNMYPHCCRFLVFDIKDEGPVQFDADIFRFWSSVSLFATNTIGSSFLQAYRLYSLNARFSDEKMESYLQSYVNRLRDVKRTIKLQLENEVTAVSADNKELPDDIVVDIPVLVTTPSTNEVEVSKKGFPLLSETDISDSSYWYASTTASERRISAAVKEAERSLDRTVNEVRSVFNYDEEDVEPLNKYQEEDLNELIQDLYTNIVRIQSTLPDKGSINNQRIKEASNSVERFLRTRIRKYPAVLSFVVTGALMLLSLLPAIIYFFIDKRGFPEFVGLTFVCEFLLAFIAGMVVLAVYKLQLNSLVQKYNVEVVQRVSSIFVDSNGYSKYISYIASHCRGKDYLEHVHSLNKISVDKGSEKYKHLSVINTLLSRIKRWNTAFHLNIDFDSDRSNETVVIDSSVAPSENSLYQFNFGDNYSVEINDTGFFIKSPFNFVTNLDIEREELYEHR